MPPSSSELIRAVGHPLRRRILNAYAEGAIESATAPELADALDRRVGQVAYHLKTLAKSEILRPVQSHDRQKDVHYVWVLGVEAEWLRLLLAISAEAGLAN